MGSIQWLNRDLHYFTSSLHDFVNFSIGFIDDSAPLPRDSKAFYAINFIPVIESFLINLHALSNISADGVFCIDDTPWILLENEYRLRAVPEIVKKVFERNIISYFGKFVNLIKGTINLILVLLNINVLRFFEGIEVVWELQSTQSWLETLQ